MLQSIGRLLLDFYEKNGFKITVDRQVAFIKLMSILFPRESQEFKKVEELSIKFRSSYYVNTNLKE